MIKKRGHTIVARPTEVSPSCWITPVHNRKMNIQTIEITRGIYLTLRGTVRACLYYSIMDPPRAHRRPDGLQDIRDKQR